jgi:3'-phosphoadenosine 5'-phosphosulfate sulfotransferase (PAPS reductase)/FAD synthetase
MKYIFSWGGGVNSTAILAMMRLGMLPELTPENTTIVFADTGAEMPYTYEHTTTCRFMDKQKWKWVLLHPMDERWAKYYPERLGGLPLPEYCLKNKVIPTRMFRWCSGDLKVKPINAFKKTLGEDVTTIIGIANDEQKRAKELGKPNIWYPLIDHSLTRQGCIDIIRKAGLPEAKKSGCYFCPFQTKDSWLEVYHNFPDLFAKTEQIENNCKQKDFYLRGDKPIKHYIDFWLKKQKKECDQPDMFELDRHCLCEL